MKLRSKNLLVTGGSGFIGSNFINYILNKYKNVKIYNLDKLTYAGNKKNTINFEKNKRYTFIAGDICNEILLKDTFENYQIDGVINFAAESHVDNSILNPEIFIQTNIIGVHKLLKTAYSCWMYKPYVCKEKFNYARFHQISTDEVFGSIKIGSFTEKDQYKPSSPYSASKASADMLVSAFFKTYGLNVSTTICSNNYGPNQHSEKLIPNIQLKIRNNKNINLYGDGNNIRDWIHVLDHCRAIDIIFNNAKKGDKYNVSSGEELKNIELVNLIFESLDKKTEISYIDDRYGHDFRYSLNSKKINSEFGWKPNYKVKKYLETLNK